MTSENMASGVEAVPLFRPMGAEDAVAVQPARSDLRQIAVPNLVGLFLDLDALQFAPSALIEQAQLHLVGMLRKQGEVDTLPIPGRTSRVGFPRPDSSNRIDHLVPRLRRVVSCLCDLINRRCRRDWISTLSFGL